MDRGESALIFGGSLVLENRQWGRSRSWQRYQGVGRCLDVGAGNLKEKELFVQ